MLPEAAVSTAALLGGLFVRNSSADIWVVCEMRTVVSTLLCCSFPFFHPLWLTRRIVGGRKIPRCYILIGDALNGCWTFYMLHFSAQVLLCISHGDICGRSLCSPPGEEGCQQFILHLHQSRFYGNYECCKSLFHLYHVVSFIGASDLPQGFALVDFSLPPISARTRLEHFPRLRLIQLVFSYLLGPGFEVGLCSILDNRSASSNRQRYFSSYFS